MNSTETLEKRSEAIGSTKKNANHSRYDVNYMLEKQRKKDDRLNEKVENKAEELKAKSALLWDRMETRRRHIRQDGITEE